MGKGKEHWWNGTDRGNGMDIGGMVLTGEMVWSISGMVLTGEMVWTLVEWY
jgi:hypothetical protein